jgi:hypothetical protein
MLPCAVANLPPLFPAHSVAFGPVCAAYSPFQVHHRELASLLGPVLRQRIAILCEDLADDRRRLRVLAQQLDRARAVADVDDRLGGRDAGIGVGPQHPVADREDARLHGAADFAGRRVEAEDRERAGVPQRFGRGRMPGGARSQRHH